MDIVLIDFPWYSLVVGKDNDSFFINKYCSLIIFLSSVYIVVYFHSLTIERIINVKFNQSFLGVKLFLCEVIVYLLSIEGFYLHCILIAY